MKLEQQVTSLELSNKLKELGVKQDSWFAIDTKGEIGEIKYALDEHDSFGFDGFCSAFTVAELGEMLPVEIRKAQSKHWYILEIEKTKECWFIRYKNKIDSWLNIGFKSNTEIDARAKMLIYLIEEKLI